MSNEHGKGPELSKMVIPEELIVVPMRDMVVFPFMMLPIFFTRDEVIKALKEAMLGNHIVVLIAQKDIKLENPSTKDLYSVGTAVNIKQLVNLPEGGIKVVAEGVVRIKIIEYTQTEAPFKAKVEVIKEFQEKNLIMDALVQSVNALFKLSLSLGRPLSEDVMSMIERIDNPARLADLIAVYLPLNIEEEQEILETLDPLERLKKAFLHLNNEVKNLQVKSSIHEGVAQELGKGQKEYLLRQQMKAIQKELGEEDSQTAEISELRKKMDEAEMPDAVFEVAKKELDRLEKMNPASAEYSVARTYIDYLVTMPWNKATVDNMDINRAEEILN